MKDFVAVLYLAVYGRRVGRPIPCGIRPAARPIARNAGNTARRAYAQVEKQGSRA